MTFTKKYWSRGEFLILRDGNQIDYSGYVGISNGKAYIYNTKEELIPKNLYINRIALSDKHFDRTLNQELKLPFSKSDVTFAPNDFAHGTIIKTIAERLQANNDYIYQQAIISNNILPTAKVNSISFYGYADSNLEAGSNDKEAPLILKKISPDKVEIANNLLKKFSSQTKQKDLYYAYDIFGEKHETLPKLLKFKKGLKDTSIDLENYCTNLMVPHNQSNISDIIEYDAKTLYLGMYFLSSDENIKIPSFEPNMNIIYSPDDAFISSNTNNKESKYQLEIEKYQKIPDIKVIHNYSFLFKNTQDNEEKLYEAHSGLTYGELFYSLEWSSSNALKYQDNIEENDICEFTPSFGMTAEDVYIYAKNNPFEYIYPAIKRVTKFLFPVKNKDIETYSYVEKVQGFNNIPLVENPHYLISKYKIEPDKSICEIYEELYDEKNGIVNQQKYDLIPDIFKKVSYEISALNNVQKYDFTQVVDSEIIVDSVSTDNVNLLIFLLFKQKLNIVKAKYNLNNNPELTDDFYDINFENSIEIENVSIDALSNLAFTDLHSIKIYGDKLYLVDSNLDMVLQYDISYLLAHAFERDALNDKDNILKESIKLVNVLQGHGDISDKIYFNTPTSIAANEERVYVVDRGNKCVKSYTSSLNFVGVLKNGFFANHDIQAVGINPFGCIINDKIKVNKDSVWIISAWKNRIFISILDNDKVVAYGQIEDISLRNGKNTWKEEVKSIVFSQSNSNYFYISTNKQVYKFQVSKPFSPLGSMNYIGKRTISTSRKWSDIYDKWEKFVAKDENDKTSQWSYMPVISSSEVIDNKCFSLASHDAFEGDIIFHFNILYDSVKLNDWFIDNYSDGEITINDIPINNEFGFEVLKLSSISIFRETDSYISSLSDNNIDMKNIIKLTDDIKNDYVNPLTFNKLIKNVLYNLLNIKNVLIGHFQGATNIDGVMIYDNTIIDTYFNDLLIGDENNYLIHINEPLSISVNRTFENIYNIQKKIIDKIQTSFKAAQSNNNITRLI